MTPLSFPEISIKTDPEQTLPLEIFREIPFIAPEPKHREATGIPDDVFPVPSGEIGYLPSGERIFPIVGKEQIWFLRGTVVNEVVTTPEGYALSPLSVERAISSLEYIATKTGYRIARREMRGDRDEERETWRSSPMPQNHMDILLQSDKAREYLPAIRQLVACPVLAPSSERDAVVLEQGYHNHAGGTFITGNVSVPEVPLHAAVASLIELHADFAFCSESDRARAIAFAISPAMRSGGWINDDFPLHVAEALKSQSGKDYLQKLPCAIYGETSSGIAPSRGGVGSVDETLSRALIAGRPFICLSNFRGFLESAVLESAIRGQGRVECRALRIAATVDCSTFNWQLSTNGAEFTRDLANRSVVTRLRKQEPGYAFRQYPEGDVLAHVRATQGYYLGCVHAVIREWASRGRPVTAESRHDFRGWCRVMDWIVTEIFDLPPLLDGHQEQQDRVANPALQWLRDIAVAVIDAGRDGEQLSALNIVEIGEDADIDLPGRLDSKDEPKFRIGRVMKKIFAEGGTIIVDSVSVTRHTGTENDDNGRTRERHRYTFSPCSP